VLSPLAELTAPPPVRIDLPMLPVQRAPYFCSGCPHNRSTAIPEGSLAGGGIGCHIMVTTSGRADSEVVGLTQMGGEGAQWIGQAGFSDVDHLFQNVGDGTFFHSGQLAVQACVAAGVNITYKLLYNDVVAMTGAQDAEAALPIQQLTTKLHAEGVSRIIVCTEEPRRYRRRQLAPGTEVWHRDRLDEAQRVLRETPGVTVLVYDQHCAADARRQRKRGKLEPRPTRVVINEAVCEGCGDCGVKSNCLSVQPVDTELGRKTRIDQTSCNTDYTCLQGDCPSFMTLQLPESAPKATVPTSDPPACPDPETGELRGVRNVFMAGIGGTGILTVNQVLATAALMAGLEVESLDQTGLSQKAGPVTGHLRFSAGPMEPANRLSPGSADCLLAFDLLTAATERNLSYGSPERTVAVASTSKTPTGDMVYDKTVAYPETGELLQRLASVSEHVLTLDALAAAEQLFGDTTYANFLVVGAAYQAGALPIPATAIEAAIEVNGTAVATNVAAFRWGRVCVARPLAFAEAVEAPVTRTPARFPLPADTAIPQEHRDFVARRAADLVAFQSERTARAYVARVESVARAEAEVSDSGRLTGLVAQHLYRLTAYKDEYEVARLLTDPEEVAAVRDDVPGGTRATYHLHPPALRALGMKRKITFRPGTHWVLRLLARLKFLRGTPLDVFGYAEVRRWERELVRHYVEVVDHLCTVLHESTYERALAVAGLPEMVRGFEDIKLASIERYVEALDAHDVARPRLAG
jgi:indolepyruvate ferredoxin oxidoreductase